MDRKNIHCRTRYDYLVPLGPGRGGRCVLMSEQKVANLGSNRYGGMPCRRGQSPFWIASLGGGCLCLDRVGVASKWIAAPDCLLGQIFRERC